MYCTLVLRSIFFSSHGHTWASGRAMPSYFPTFFCSNVSSGPCTTEDHFIQVKKEKASHLHIWNITMVFSPRLFSIVSIELKIQVMIYSKQMLCFVISSLTTISVFLGICLNVISTLLDIIVLSVRFPGNSSTESFSAVMAIFNLVLR
jgi:hypothetical protein